MNTNIPIEKMLTRAYTILGVRDKEQLQEYVRLALDHLKRDREYYIELTREALPEDRIDVQHGRICKLIPLAQRKETNRYLEYTRETQVILALMVAEGEQDYVYIHHAAELYKNAEENQYNTPAYSYADLQKLADGLVVATPQEIRPVTTAFEWDCYCMAFAAFSKLCKNQVLNTIPHKTERAMTMFPYIKQESICLDNKTVTGKLLPLARSGAICETMQMDPCYSEYRELHLLAMEEKIGYVIRTTRIYKFVDEDTEEDQKRQVRYRYITWEEIPEDLHPLYY